MEQQCDGYLTSGDSAILLVAISERFSSREGLEDVSSTLLLDKYQSILAQLGWDLIDLLVPRLPPSDSRGWELLASITTRCSPKEMCLALLEQMSQLDNGAVFFRMLKPLRTVAMQLRPLSVISTLKETAPLASAVLCRLKGSEPTDTGGAYGSGDEERPEDVEENSPREGAVQDEQSTCDGLLQLVEFIAPFVDLAETVKDHKTLLQSQCATFLLSLMDYPLIALKHKTARPVCLQIVHQVIRCRCGALQLLQWEGDVESEARPPVLGVAFFAYMLLVGHVEQSYLPLVIRKDYLLHILLTHVKTLLQRPEGRVALKGLALLRAVLVPVHSISSCVLDDPRYVEIAELLCCTTVNSQHKTVREKSLKMVQDFINIFDSLGRYRLYNLCHSVKHSGLLGLLIFHIKNEVDMALRRCGSGECPFLGHSLVPLLNQTLVVREDEDLLADSDRVLGALNFLRFLLIRDKPCSNKTGIWAQASSLTKQFTGPLRRALHATKMYAREEIAKREQASMECAPQDGHDPVVTVQVLGERLPEVSPKDELQAIHAALQRLDMIECVLVRVEELLETTK